MKLGNIDAIIDGEWKVVEDSGELTSAVTTYTFSNLDGDTDIEYNLVWYTTGRAEGVLYVSFNGDTTAGNYGYQRMYGAGAVSGALRDTANRTWVGYLGHGGDTTFGQSHIYAKSGKPRTFLTTGALELYGSYVGHVNKWGSVWDNTTDNLVSIEMTSQITNGIGIGSRFILLKKVHCQDAMKTGEITPNKMQGVWERIFSTDTHSTPYAHYVMNESEANTTVLDTGTGANNGTSSTNTVNLATAGKAENAVFDKGAFFNGVNNYLSVPNHDDWDLIGSDSDNWTIDFWVKHDDHAGADYYMSQAEDVSNAWRFYHNDGVGLNFLAKSGGSTILAMVGGGEIIDNNWHHVALIKVADEWAFYLDGEQVNYLQDDSTDTFTADLHIGTFLGGNYLHGAMDEVRIEESNAFSASPQPLPYTHYKCNDSTASTTVIDDTINANNGTSSTNTTNIDAVGKIEGAFDFVSSSSHRVNCDLVAADIASDSAGTLCFWAKTDGNTATIISFSDANTGNSMSIYEQADGDLNVYHVSGGTVHMNVDTTNKLVAGVWSHWAIVQDGTLLKIYKNGSLETLSWTTSTDQGAWCDDISGMDSMRLADLYSSSTEQQFWDGALDDVRYYKQALTLAQVQAIYNSDDGTESNLADTITVPTSEHTATGTTNLLLHLDANLTDDGDTGHTVTNNNNVSLGAMDFASSRYVTVNNLATDLASDTVGTFMCWANYPAVSSHHMFVLADVTDAGSNFNIYFSGGSILLFIQEASGTVVNAYTSFTASVDTWYHIAVVQDGTQVKIYVNGDFKSLHPSSSGTMSAWCSAVNNIDEGRIAVGLNSGGESNYGQGKLDDVRWYKNAVSQEAIQDIYNAGNGTEKQTTLAPTVFPATEVNIPELTGDTDVLYKLVAYFVGGAATSEYSIIYNEDTGSNYGRQVLYAFSATVGAGRTGSLTEQVIGYNNASGNVCMSETLIYAKSGEVRPLINEQARTITGTTVTEIDLFGWAWDNVVSDISKIALICDTASGLGVGTHIELWRLNL